MKGLRNFILFFLFTGFTNCLFAQVSFTTKASASAIGKSELLEVNYEVQNGEIENFMQPDFPGWQVVGGPNVSSSTFISNGQKTVSMSYQFILKPRSTGTFTLPGAKAVIDGKTLTSNPVLVIVDNKIHQNNQPSTQQSLLPLFDMPQQPPAEDLSETYDGYILREGENIEEKTKKNLFIVINVSKKTCYEGEAIVADYKLYSRVNLNAHITRRPSFSGFSSIDLPNAANREFEIETYKGKQFRVYNVRKVQLYPLLAGTQTLEPVELEATIQYRKVPSADNMLHYDPFSPNNSVSFPYIIRSEPVPITILPFPKENKPEGFTSVTGIFDIKASVKELELAKNQAGTLRVEIEGAGNWAMMQTPKINWPPGVEAFEPTVIENLDSQQVPVTGKKVFDFPFSSADSGLLNIPPVTLAYFDPVNKTYASISSDPLQVKILNTTLPTDQPLYRPQDYLDFTQVFTDIVVVAFPIIAIILLVWVVAKYKQRRRFLRSNQPWKKPVLTMPETAPTHWETYTESRYMPGNQKETTASPIENKIALSFDENEVVATLDNSPQNQNNATGDLANARQYFEKTKNEIAELLRQHWRISDCSASSIRQLLVAKGMLAEDAESIGMLLEACEKHIYSPFTEQIDTLQWNEILLEIKFILERKNSG